ncbi:hypothetical protein A1OO_08580 [Enterovibrio norvegicus FF-33]|uniref:hypothetical protein n=1 Tax=Enterovibrio norvegicus TaxID=188144 RepID=UPI0002DD005E|nr:hypothetical protein [Enterovibrio norvegicus]OEE65854.1 hypothetical protein A1OO_08580 [Enterovibrio norvegicus FF-33]
MGVQNIVYVGPKAFKRDTVTGTRQVFPRLTPIEVTDENAAMLLRFEHVFIAEGQLDTFLSEEKVRVKTLADEQAKQEEEAKALQQAMDMTVTLHGDVVDLSKMTGPKLATLVESIDALTLEPKGPQEPMPEYRKRVRDALRDVEEIAG